MFGAMGILMILNIFVFAAIIGFALHLGFRFVRAFEKISDTYDRKNK